MSVVWTIGELHLLPEDRVGLKHLDFSAADLEVLIYEFFDQLRIARSLNRFSLDPHIFSEARIDRHSRTVESVFVNPFQ